MAVPGGMPSGKAQKKPRVVKVKPPGPPNFPKLVPVRPGAPTPEGATKPSSQAQRTHVHKARVQRAKLIQKKPDFPTATKAVPVKRTQKASDGGGGLLATALNVASKAAPVVVDAAMGPIAASGHLAVQKATGLKILPTINKTASNAPKDAAELVATTPTSTYLLGKTAVTNPTRVPGMLAAPYKELAAHPGKFITEHPVSTALMLQPAVRSPGLAAGKVLRLAGKQTLKGETRTLAGTALRQETRLSKSVVSNALQARKQSRNPTPTITDKEIRRRVDEHFEYRRKHVKRVEASKGRELAPEVKALPKPERAAFKAEELKGARGGAGTPNDRTFVREFGSPWQVTPGKVVDEGGPAVRIYHGTTPEGAASLRQSGVDIAKLKRGTIAEGFSGTTHRATAEEYAGVRGEVVAADVKFRKPFVWDAKAYEQMRAEARAAGKSVTDALRAKGYDGVVIPGGRGSHAEHIVLDPRAATIVGGKSAPVTRAILKPKNATEGHLHASREDAQTIVERLKAAGHGEFAVKPVSENEFGVVPKAAADQLHRHQVVGTGKATYAKVLRASRQKFTNAVLPLSPKWLTGQVVEGTGRALVHAGPVGIGTGLLREAKVFRALEKERPGAGKEFRARALPGGHYGGQVQEFRRTPLHELFNEADDGKIGAWLAKAGRAGEKTPGAKRVVNGWNRYTRTVFDQVNGRFIENTQQRAMLGRSLKDSPLMERRLLGLSNKAASEAAKGLRGTETQVEFGRAVERAYGKYSNFSPSQRERNLHWTPFLPWYSNAVKFLGVVLPKDHPVLTSLLAAGNVATQKEREKLGLSTRGKGAKPSFMQGGIPAGGGKVVRVGHYTPFALGESKPSESAASLVLPQFAGTFKNLSGIDWKGAPLKKGSGYKGQPFNEPATWARALSTQAEALIPGAAQAARVTGLEDKLAGKSNASTVLNGKDLAAALRKEVDPFMATSSASPKPKGKRKAARKQHDILGGTGAGTVDILK